MDELNLHRLQSGGMPELLACLQQLSSQVADLQARVDRLEETARSGAGANVPPGLCGGESGQAYWCGEPDDIAYVPCSVARGPHTAGPLTHY